MLRGWRYLFILLLLPLATQAQVVFDSNPTGLKWYWLETDHFRIMYPERNEPLAQRMANLMETVYEPVSKTLGVEPKKITVVLQNQTTISNGFVSYSPRRSEFFTTPPQDYNFVGTNEWMTLLAVHEYRHVAQFARAYTGFNKLNMWLGGEAGFGGFSFLVMPSWFWEGDAVGLETALTPSGRGRIPEFNMVYRTSLLEHGGWNYSKQYLRSYKDFVPNHYVTGYFLTTHLRQKTQNPHIWDDLLGRSFAFPYLPWRIDRALKKETGMNLEQTFREMQGELKDRWEAQLEGLELTPVEVHVQRKTNQDRRIFTQYLYPQELEDGRVVALKTGLGDIERLVALSPNGEEERLYTPGIVYNSGMLSQGGGKVAWIENEFDPRWRARDYAVVRVYDVASDKVNKLNHGTRYVSVAVSPDGQKLAVIGIDIENKHFLEILNTADGSSQQVMQVAGENVQVAMPRWTTDGKSVVYLHTEGLGKKSLRQWTPATNAVVELLPASDENIGYPVPWKQYVFYNSPYSGIDNIYALDTHTGQKYQVTSRPYGAFNPEPSEDGKRLYFNDFTVDGHNVVSMELDPEQWLPVEHAVVRVDDLYQVWVEQEEGMEVLDEIPEKQYAGNEWVPFPGLFNPYVWGANVDPTSGATQVGVGLQDEMSTMRARLNYSYNPSENTNGVGLNLSIQRFYPILDLSVNNDARAVELPTPSGGRVTEAFRQRTLGAEVRVPLILTRGRFLQGVTAGVGLENIRVTGYDNPIRYLNQVGDNGSLTAFRYRLTYYSQLKQSTRDLAPRWGVYTSTQIRRTPQDPGTASDPNLIGSMAGNTTIFYLPGLGKHHTLQVRTSVQKQFAPRDTAGFLPSNAYVFSSPFFGTLRGYDYTLTEEFYLGSVSYGLPLLYPDLALWRLAYIQRISATAFFDYGYFRTSIGEQIGTFDYRTVGLDLNFDVNGMRYLPQFNVGVRVGYAMDHEDEPLFVGLLVDGLSLSQFRFPMGR